MVNNVLDVIVERLRPEVAARKRRFPLAETDFPTVPSLRSALPGVIAEVKKASPSKGVIRADFHPVELAMELAAAGAAALSVLTEPNYFLGDLGYLKDIAAQVDIPVLRKDFIFDEYQLLEARHAGASAALLIAAMLDAKRLAELTAYAHRIGLEVLGEAHNADELAILLDTPVDLIGVNARNLQTFATDLGAVEKLLAQIPPDRCPVAESAIGNAGDLQRLSRAGAQGFLIGETLMRASSPGEKLRELQS